MRGIYIIFCVLFSSLAFTQAMAQGSRVELGTTGLNQIKPLQIGDTIPESLWHTPLQVVNHPDQASVLRLADYKNRVIIIDFWSTYCAACIVGFPKFINLQKQYGDKILFLPVTAQPKEIIQQAIGKNSYFKGLENALVVSDKNLSAYFEHQTIPHIVWIDREGILRATTSAKHVMTKYIDQLLLGGTINWANKQENTDLMQSPSLSRSDPGKGDFSYSAVLGYISGIPRYHVYTESDSIGRFKTLRYANHSIFHLYMRAFGRFLSPVNRNRIVFENCVPASIMFSQGENLSLDNWMEYNGKGYESRLLSNTPRTSMRAKMLADLNFHLGMDVFFEKRDLECLMLNVTDSTLFKKIISQTGDSEVVLITDAVEKKIRNAALTSLVDALNYLEYPIPVLSDIDPTIKVSMNLHVGDLLSLGDLNKEMARYGIQFKEGKRLIEVLVFHKNEEV